MRRLLALLALIATSALTAQVLAATPPASTAASTTATKGLWLLTDYPSQTVRAGEVTNVHFKLQNAGLPPEPLELSLSGVPTGWKIEVMGSGQPVAAAMPAMN